ncbi:hypothetical protein ACKFKG_23425 [Phormidesmis sp. 146-35]
MTTELTTDYQNVLANAASRTGRPNPDRVVEALLEAEKAAKKQRLTYPLTPLLGQWRLCFTTGTRKLRKRGGIALGKGFYLPQFVPAGIGFSPVAERDDYATINNQIQVGGLQLKFTGLAKYLGKKNLLAFDFSQIQISVGKYAIYTGQLRGGKTDFEERSVAQLPFFAFFLVTETFIAARGRGGGLALWTRE